LQKMTFDSDIILLSKLYAVLIIAMPFLIPLLIIKIHESLSLQVRRKTLPLAFVAMVIPTMIMMAILFIEIMPLEISINSYLKYLNPIRYLYFFVPANLLFAIIMTAPKDRNSRNFIDRSIILKILFNLLVIGYFVAALLYLVLH
jgi:hypothetical protein